jgi:hypothetical protein
MNVDLSAEENKEFQRQDFETRLSDMLQGYQNFWDQQRPSKANTITDYSLMKKQSIASRRPR